MQYLKEIVLPNYPLILSLLKIVLPNYSLILSLLKYRNVWVFWNKKKIRFKQGQPLKFFYEKKKKLLPHKTLFRKNRTTLPVHLRWFLYYYLRGSSCLDSSFFSSKIPLHPYIYVETKLKDNPVKMQF